MATQMASGSIDIGVCEREREEKRMISAISLTA